ncbi:MAG: hypothetical protein FJ041_04315 [Candidatus Cloacimonetes bacterium]|nr:hypothetical protein [Candidatus Cloacimonadota bacterium]
MKYKLLVTIGLSLILLSHLNALEYEKKPYKAMLYSAVVPGGGQFYNEAYLKTALVIGVQALLTGLAIDDYNQMKRYEKEQNPIQKKYYQDELRSDYWWMGITLVLSMADAFVDAHLYNFDAERSKVRLKFEDKLLKMEYRFN